MKDIPTRHRIPVLTDLLEFREITGTPIGYCERMVREYGDVCCVPLPGVRNYMIHDVELLQEVFVNQASKFKKSRLYQAMQKVVGLGLLTSDGDYHLQQRRLVAPAFHRQRIQEYADTMVQSTLDEMETWQENEMIDMQTAMSNITMHVITQTMFSSRVSDAEIKHIGKVVADLLERAAKVFQNPFYLICFEKDIRIPPVQRVHELAHEVDGLILEIIRSYRRHVDSSSNDMLSMLLRTRDEDNGLGLDDKQIRDEIITMFMAGHETTATALNWVWYLLGRHEKQEEDFYREVRSQIPSKRPQATDFQNLVHTKNVFKEALRLYPPAWTIAREPLNDVEIMGYHFPKGSVLCTLSYIMHRKPEFFHEPNEFIPDRWMSPALSSLPRFVYFPFGAGTRICIGEGFAWMEAMMILSTVGARFRMSMPRDFTTTIKPLFTLRSQDPVMMRATRV